MVCKEDVLTWFKDAASYKRIDVMCSLLNMCIPFELRYLGTCIEEQGKHDYQELRGAALIANSLDKLAKELCGGKSLLEKCTRHRLTVYVSLLQSRNYTCAQWMYSVLLRSDAFDMFIASGAFNKDITLHTELLLLYTMVLNHPAFTFDQKRYFGEIVTRLSEYEMPTTTMATGALVPPPTHNPQQPPPPCPPGLGYAIKAPLPVCVHHIPLTVGKPPNPLGHGEPPMPPPGIPLPTVHGEFVSPQGIWSRTHYISTTCPPPEMTAFPPPISPLVSQQSSPTPSRSVSPSRMYTCRPHPPPPPPPSTATIVTHMDRLPPPQVKDPLVMPTPQYNTDLKTVPIDEVSHGDVGDKSQQHQWLDAVVMAGKLPNGLIPGVPVATAKCPTMFISGDMQNLSLDGDMPLRCSSSSASSNSSDCHSPPDTPTGPGRGPHGGGGGGHLPLDGGGKICRTANVSGPPGLSAPLPTAADLAVTTFTNNCTVPYSTHYPPTTSFHPSRTMYYSQTYRPHQFPPAAYQQNGEIPYMFPPHYLPMLYSSAAAAAAAAAAAPAPMPPAKLVNCYNCGMTGHTGAECKEPTIEEITQKKGYQLEYTTPPPEIQPQQQQGTIVDKQHQPHQQSQQQHQQSQQPNQQQQ